MRKLVLYLFAFLLFPIACFAQPPSPTQCVTTVAAGGTGDQIQFPAIPCWPTTTLVIMKAGAANTTTTPAISVNGGAFQTITNFDGTPLSVGLFQPGQYRLLSYNGTNWLALSAGAIFNTQGLAVTPTNATLKAIVGATNGQTYYRAGFATAGDGGGATYTFSSANCTAADDGAEVQPTTGTGCWIVSVPPTGLAFAVWGTKGDGSTDDTTAFMAAVAWCNAGGATTSKARTLLVGAGRYVVNASPTLSYGCVVSGPSGFAPEAPQNSPAAITLPSAILLGAGQTINQQSGSTLQYVRIVPVALTPPTSFQDAFTKIASFSGTGVTIDDADNVILRYVLIVGFNQCVGTSGIHNAREVIDHLWLDCTNGLAVDNAHDVDEISFIRGWQFFNGNNACVGGTDCDQDIETVSGVANNGSGAIRLTVGSTANMATGNTIVTRRIDGALGANGVWPITVIDGTHIDLQGSNFTSVSATGTETTGQGLVAGLSSLTGVWEGEAVSGTGVPAATTVLAVDYVNGNLWLSNLATATGSETLTFSTGTYTSGGQAILDAARRTGTFIKTTNSDEVHYTDLFEFGWQIGYNVNSGQWQEFHNIGCDGESYNTNICVLTDGTAFRPSYIGVNYSGGPAVAFMENTAEFEGSLVRGLYLEGGPNAADAKASIILNVNDGVDIDGRDNGGLNFVANYNATGNVRFAGLFTDTHLLQSSIPPMNGTAMPMPQIVGQHGWVPRLLLGGGNTGITYGSTIGTYTMEPDGLMNMSLKLTLTSKGTSTGVADLTNLPTPCVSPLGNDPPGSGIVGFFANMATSVATMYLNGDGTLGDEIDIRQNATSGTSLQLTDAGFTNTSQIFANFSCYTR